MWTGSDLSQGPLDPLHGLVSAESGYLTRMQFTAVWIVTECNSPCVAMLGKIVHFEEH